MPSPYDKYDKCKTFIKEFGAAATELMHVPSEVKVLEDGLRYDEVNEVVRYYVVLQLRGCLRLLFQADCSWYNPSLPREDCIDLMASNFDLSEEEAEEELKAAGLLR